MTQTFNVYCDESCHLENDHQPIMVLGAVWCPLEKVREIAVRLREIKARYGFPPTFEVKWKKVSHGRLDFYMSLMDFFFKDDDLHFRALIVPDKTVLRHEDFQQTHDDFYYKMYFDMLKVILNPEAHYRIYLDIKDTRSADKVVKLHEVLCNNLYDFSREIIERVQNVKSDEVEQVQLADLLIGAISYANRALTSNSAKTALVERMRQCSHYQLTKTTLIQESKVNLFRWHGKKG